MRKIIFSLFDNTKLGSKVAKALDVEKGVFELRHFSDEETYIRIESNVKDNHVVLFCPLDHPNSKVLPLYFLAKTIKELEAKKLTLVTPYLPYMRQDQRFKMGEAVTSNLFAQLVSIFCDSLITIDPHLHRIKNISEIYSIPTTVLHASLPISTWILENIKFPLIIGPDEESAQWSFEVAQLTNSPCIVATKKRLSDKNVIIELPEIHDKNYTPVIIDDIISTGSTMHAITERLLEKKFKNPICIGIHALFKENNYKELIRAGAKEVITCDTVFHPSNQITVFNVLLEGIKQC